MTDTVSEAAAAEIAAYIARGGQVGVSPVGSPVSSGGGGGGGGVSSSGTGAAAAAPKTQEQRKAEKQPSSSLVGTKLSIAESEAMMKVPIGGITDVRRAVSSGAVSGYSVDIAGQPTEYFLTEQAAQQYITQAKPQARQPQARQPQAQAQGQIAQSQTPILTAAMARTQFDYSYAETPGIPKEEWLTMTRKGWTPQVMPDAEKGYVWRPPELSQKEKVLLSVMPSGGIELSAFSANIYRQAQNAAEAIRGLDKGFVRAPGFDPGADLTGLVKESIARTVEFGGAIPGTVETIGRAAIKSPAALPGMAVVGGLFVVGGIAEQAEKEPAQLVADVAVMGGIFHGVRGAGGKISETIKFRGKEYVPPEMIIDPQALRGVKYPEMPRGSTPADMITEFKKGEFRLPGTEEKLGGWHATPSEWAKETVTQAGTSELPGTYIAPATVPHYWKINRGYKLFGWDAPPETPTGIWMGIADVRRSPVSTRMSLAAQARFLTESAPKDVAYVSAAFEKGIKMEKEAIIPPEAKATRVRFEQYTKWEGKKVPLMEYKVEAPKAEALEFMTGDLFRPSIRTTSLGTKITIKPPSFKGGINKNLLMTGDLFKPAIRTTAISGAVVLGAAAKPPSPQKETVQTAGQLMREQQTALRRYREYQTPVITPESLASSLFRPSQRSRISSPSSVRSSIRSASRSTAQSIQSQIRSSRPPSPVRSSIPSRPPGYPSLGTPSYPSSRPPGYPPSRPPGYPPSRPPGYPPGYPPRTPSFIPLQIPKLQGLGKFVRPKGRRAAGYTVRNPFTGLKDLFRGL